MSENYEYDEWGGHKPQVDENGNGEYPGLGCISPGCKAGFFTPQARTAHIATMHPTENSGPSPEMIFLARIRPEIAPKMGMTPEEAQAPMNVHEMEEEARANKVMSEQNMQMGEIHSHPLHQMSMDMLSDVRMAGAEARQNTQRVTQDQEIKDDEDAVNHHVRQFVAGFAINKSIYAPHTHMQNAEYHISQILRHLPNDRFDDHENRIYHHIEKMDKWLNDHPSDENGNWQ
jgi:hypothetical protein